MNRFYPGLWKMQWTNNAHLPMANQTCGNVPARLITNWQAFHEHPSTREHPWTPPWTPGVQIGVNTRWTPIRRTPDGWSRKRGNPVKSRVLPTWTPYINFSQTLAPGESTSFTSMGSQVRVLLRPPQALGNQAFPRVFFLPLMTFLSSREIHPPYCYLQQNDRKSVHSDFRGMQFRFRC